MALTNPYLDFFRALPASFRREAGQPVAGTELWSADWLALKSAIARHFSWAVPTDEAITAIRRHTKDVVEIGAGSGYWAWMMRQAGITVAACDAHPPGFTWSEVHRADERAVFDHPGKTLFLCWPPWGSSMAFNALYCYRGEHFIYVGEWMGGSADMHFFALIASQFEAVESVALPQWHVREDYLTVFRRRRLS